MKKMNAHGTGQSPRKAGGNACGKGGATDLNPGTLHSYLMGSTNNILYRSRVTDHGRYFDFVFNYVNLGGFWEIDIVRLPYYRGRDTSASTIHTMPSSRGGRKVCVAAGHEPRSEREAKRLSMSWADLQAEYIKTGRTPDQQIRDNHR